MTAGTATDAERTVAVDLGYPTGDAETTPAPPTSRNVVIAANATSGMDTVTVDALDDNVREEANESIALTVSGSDPTTVYYKPASIAIMDDDPDVTLSLNMTEVDEDAGTVTVEITATADEAVSGVTTFALALTGTATGGGTDYTDPAATSLSLTINARATTGSTTVTLTINDDGDDESNETIIFDDADGAQAAVPGGGGKTYTVAPVTLTIVDNDDT